MPIVRSETQLIYYAHVPKCGGSAVQDYLHARFGALAFEDRAYLSQQPAQRWNKTSPQHINVEALDRLFPAGFFDHNFAIVRHPVGRIISAYHFQLEVEKTLVPYTSLTEWLEMLRDLQQENPFIYDNHVRPMSDIVPDGAQIFHLEHGLDALVPWFDRVTGHKIGPRAVGHSNERGAHGGKAGARAVPTDKDLDLIKDIYCDDFDRFGYSLGAKLPAAPAPVLSEQALAERDAARNSPSEKVKRLAGTVKKLIRNR